MGIKENYEESGKSYGLEQSVSYLSKNINKSLNPLPDYSVGKSNLPAFSFSRGERFLFDRNSTNPAPDCYYTEELTCLKDKKKSDLL